MKRKFTLIVLGLLVPFVSRAAVLNITVNQGVVDIGQPFRVDVSLDTQGDDANALQGEIDFPPSQFALQGINDGASPFTFWMTPPAESASGVVSFAGIVPGGFEGAASSVVSLWLMPLTPGAGSVTASNIQLLADDGQGTPLAVTVSSATIMVASTVASSSPSRPLTLAAPEPFTPVVTRDPNVFGGKYFLVFSAVDKGSGIDHYEVLEAPTGGSEPGVTSAWQVATSPYLLKDQSLSSNIFVRAVGHSGNFIVVEVPAAHPISPSERKFRSLFNEFGWYVLFLLFVICVMLFLKRKRYH